MRNLWFKQIYVPVILSGEKTDTIRSPKSRVWPINQVVGLSVGPRPPFARAIITGFEQVSAESLGERLMTVAAFYGQHPNYTRISFRVIEQLPSISPQRLVVAQ